jgi:hypothetical protein
MKIKHWILLEGTLVSTASSRKLLRMTLARKRAEHPLPKYHWYYAGKVLANGDILLVNCRRGL